VQEFGARLRYIRKKRKLTQEQLAEKASIIRTMICRYESENQIPTVEVLVKLANALEVSIDYLLGRTKMEDIYRHPINEDGLNGTLITTDPAPSPERRNEVTSEAKHAIQSKHTLHLSKDMPSTPEELEAFVRDLMKRMSNQ